MFDAMILAGGENNWRLTRCAEQPYEALIDIAGKPMVAFVAEALAASSYVRRIFIVGPAKELARYSFPASTVVVQGGKTIMETIKIGFEAIGSKKHVLVATADIPLLTPDAVDDFVLKCVPVTADFYYPIVEREINDRFYPGNKRTYVRLKEGTFTGGNLFLVNPAIVPRCCGMAEKIIANRKNPLKLCYLLGWKFIFKFIFGNLHLHEVESRVTELLGISGTVVKSGFPEVGIDVDKPSDLELVRTTFAFRAE